MGALRVVSLNLACHLPWSERKPEIVAWLHRLDPDVVLLQENTGRPGRSWADELGEILNLSVATSDDAAGAFGNAVLSRWVIDEQTAIELPWLPHDERAHFSGFLGPSALRVRTSGMYFISVHLAAEPDRSANRCDQVLTIHRACQETSCGFPVVFGGDFNADPDSDEIRFLRGASALGSVGAAYQEAWTSCGQGAGFTLDRRNSWHALRPIRNRRVDYIFAGDPYFLAEEFGGPGHLTGLVTKVALAFNETLTDTFASDHFGLAVEVQLPPTSRKR